MTDLSSAVFQMVVLLIVTIAGFVAGRLKFLDEYTRAKMGSMLINITLPCMIVASAGDLSVAEVGDQIVPAFVLGTVLFWFQFVCNWILRTPKEKRNLYLFMSLFSNMAFVGMAVASSLYGHAAVLYSSIYLLMGNVFLFSAGMYVLNRGRSEDGFNWRSMVSPPMVACLIALVLLFSGWHLPEVVGSSLSLIGSITAPVAMMIVGAIVSDSSLQMIAAEWRLYPYTFIRQLAIPLLAFVALRPLVADPVLLGSFIVMFGMPVGSLAPAMAVIMHQEPELPAKGTIITTVLSFITIPLLVALMNAIAY